MLRGTIDVQSELSKGTDITIRIPLSRVPGTETPVSTPSTDISLDGGSQDDSINVLRAQYQETAVAFYALRSREHTNETTEAGRTLRNYIEDWVRIPLRWPFVFSVKLFFGSKRTSPSQKGNADSETCLVWA